MTTLAAIMGALPIALGIGAGAEVRRPLGLAVVGGLVISQIVTLYLTPIFYTYMDEFQTWVDKRNAKGETAEADDKECLRRPLPGDHFVETRALPWTRLRPRALRIP